MAADLTSFQYAIDLVDNTITLVAEEDVAGYEYFEFSYSCSGSTYTIRGGSFVACEQGAGDLLEQMGFRFFAPTQDFWVLPSAPLPTNLSRAKMSYWMPSSSYSQTYGNGFSGPLGPTVGATITSDTNRFYDLIGWRHQPYPSGHRWKSVVVAYQEWFDANPQTIYSEALPHSFALGTMSAGDYDRVTTLAAGYLLTNAQNENNSLAKYGRHDFDAADGDLQSSDLVFQFTIDVCQKVRSGAPDYQKITYGSRTVAFTPGLVVTGATSNATATLVKVSGTTTGTLYLIDVIGTFQSGELITAAGGSSGSATTTSVASQAYSGIADAELGVYAYAGHKTQPSFDCKPYVYTGVALGFAHSSLFLPRMQAHAETSVRIMARDYLGTQTWTNGYPLIDGKSKWNYPDIYNGYYNAGCRGTQGGDGNGNWLYNLVFNRHFNMKLRYGTYTWATALADVVDGIFDSDPAVTAFYTYIMDPYKGLNRFSLYNCMLLVDDMVDGWYKTYFEQVLTLNYEHMFQPERPAVPAIGDAYDVWTTRMLNHAVGLAEDQVTHSYAWIRRMGGTYHQSRYPHLYHSNTSAVYYFDYYKPTHQEYLDAKAALLPLVDREAGLDDDDNVIVHDITPRPALTPQATGFKVENATTIIFVGPGTLTRTGVAFVDDPDTDTTVEIDDTATETFTAGTWIVQSRGRYTFTWSGGYAFLASFPTNRFEQDEYGDLWGYIPTRCAGDFRAEANSRFTLVDQVGSYDITPSVPSNDSRMNNFGPGQIRFSGTGSTGLGMIVNGNPWFSPYPTKQFMPRAIAEEDFTTIGKILKA